MKKELVKSKEYIQELENRILQMKELLKEASEALESAGNASSFRFPSVTINDLIRRLRSPKSELEIQSVAYLGYKIEIQNCGSFGYAVNIFNHTGDVLDMHGEDAFDSLTNAMFEAKKFVDDHFGLAPSPTIDPAKMELVIDAIRDIDFLFDHQPPGYIDEVSRKSNFLINCLIAAWTPPWSIKMADRILQKHGADDVFPTAPPCPTCGRRIFLNDELAKQFLPTCQRCQGYGYLVNFSDGSKSKCPECKRATKQIHINPKWNKEEIIQAIEEYNAELDTN